MVKLTRLEYWHTFRPPNRCSLFVDPGDVSSIRELPFDHNRSEKASEIRMKDGSSHIVEGNPDAVAASLGFEEEVRDSW